MLFTPKLFKNDLKILLLLSFHIFIKLKCFNKEESTLNFKNRNKLLKNVNGEFSTNNLKIPIFPYAKKSSIRNMPKTLPKLKNRNVLECEKSSFGLKNGSTIE